MDETHVTAIEAMLLRMRKGPLGDKIFSKTTTVQEDGFKKTTTTYLHDVYPPSETKEYLPPEEGLLLNSPRNWIINLLQISMKPDHHGQPSNFTKMTFHSLPPKHMLQVSQLPTRCHSSPFLQMSAM